MILSNNTPNPIWDAAMGNGTGTRFPPGSWSRGGGGYMGYVDMRLSGYGLNAAGTDVQTDVLEALNLAISELKAQGYVRFDVSAPDRAAVLAWVARAEQGVKQLMLRQGDLGTWLAQAQGAAEDLKSAAISLGDTETGPWLDQVLESAGGVSTSGIPGWAIGLGLAAAAFVGYKLLK